MDLLDLSESLGTSIIVDDYQVSFKEKRREIELSISRIEKHHVSKEALPRLYLKKAVLYMLSGNHAEAESCLTALASSVPENHHGWHRRRRCYEMLNCVLRCHPTAIRFWSRNESSSALIFEAQSSSWLTELKSRLSRFDTLDRFEHSLPVCLYQYNTYLWASHCLHPAFPRPGLAKVASPQLAAIGDPFRPGFIDAASSLKLSKLLSSLKRMELDVKVLLDPPGQDGSYDEAAHFMQRTDDLVGQALLCIRKADGILAPSFTSPLALNLVIDGKLSGAVDLVWDLEEPRFALNHDPVAQDLYQEALFLMDAANCRRGRGAVLMRQAAVIHVDAIRTTLHRKEHTTLENSGAMMEALSRASVLLQNALEDLDGDESNTNLVLCHQILLDISRFHLGSRSDVIRSSLESRAGSVGSWGRRANNPVLAQFCGLLMLRFGRRMLLDYNLLDAALACTSCATSLFRELDDETFVLSCLMTRADLVHSSGNFSEAQLAVAEARTHLDRVLHSLLRLGGDENRLGGPIANLLLTFDNLTSRILTSASDPTALAAWRQDYTTLETHVDRFLRDSRPVLAAGTDLPIADLPAELVNEQQRAQRLGQLYNTMYDEAYAELERGHVDEYEARLSVFLAQTAAMDAPTEQLATFQIVACSALGLAEDAAEHLPVAVPLLFGQQGTSTIDLLMSQVSFQDQMFDLRSQIVRQQGERAISLCFLSQAWVVGRRLLNSIATMAPGFLTLNDPTVRGVSWMMDSHIGAIHEHTDDIESALRWYLRAMHSMETHRDRNADLAGRSGVQSSIHGSELYSGLVRIALRSVKSQKIAEPSEWGLTGKTWTEQALIFAEYAAARALLDFTMSQSELVGSESGQLGNMQDVARYTFLKRQIGDLRTAPGSQGDAQKMEVESLQRQLQALEQDEGLLERIAKYTLALLTAARPNISFKSLTSVIPANALVIEINMSRSGLVVFCLTHEGIQAVHRSDTTILQMRRYILRYLNGISAYENLVRKEAAGTLAASEIAAAPALDDMNSRIARISNEIILPFHTLIPTKEHVIFVPSESFNIFPMSALLYDGRPIFLSKAVSQAPSIATLEQLAIRRPKNIGRSAMSAVFDTHTPPAVTGNSTGTNRPLTERVPGAGVTALLASNYFGSTPRHAPTVEQSAFREAYEKSNIVLLSTHGHRSPNSPWQSYIKLAQDFRVMEVLQYHTQASLIVFGACLSATGRVTAGNDVYGFSHAVLQSGARAYMGALWSAHDFATMLLLVSFFRHLAQSQNEQSLAYCFQQAQKTLYELSNPAAVAMLKAMLAELSALIPDGSEMENLKQRSLKYIRRQIKDLEDGIFEPDFKHPYYWAPFGLIGHAGISLQ